MLSRMMLSSEQVKEDTLNTLFHNDFKISGLRSSEFSDHLSKLVLKKKEDIKT